MAKNSKVKVEVCTELTLAPAQPALAEPEKEDRARACTGDPATVAAQAKHLRVAQESTNTEVVWIVANGWNPGIYMTAAGAKAQWHRFSKARHCAMNRLQFEAGEHVTWYKQNYGQEDCVIKPHKGRKRKAAADESDSDDQ